VARVVQLGHIGLYVRDLERMASFYRDFLGMQVTKRNSQGSMVFLSSDPKASDHEIALIKGRPSAEDPHLINQISMRVETLDDLRDFHRRLLAENYSIQRVVNHGSALGCYFLDPEGNVTEIFWRSGYDCWAPTGEPVDLATTSDEAILAHVQTIIERERDVPMGTVRTPVATPA
jgi:catechol-2,3-dioxygenase